MCKLLRCSNFINGYSTKYQFAKAFFIKMCNLLKSVDSIIHYSSKHSYYSAVEIHKTLASRYKADPRICLPRYANCQDLQISSQSNLANMALPKTRFTDAHRNLDETTEIAEAQGCKRKAVRRRPLPKFAIIET